MNLFDMEPDVETAQDFLKLKPEWCQGDQRPIDAATLIAFGHARRDGRFLEIGTSAGEGAAALLYGARSGSATLVGLDLAQRVYYDKSRRVGGIVQDALPELANRYTVVPGVMSNHVRHLEGPFDLVHIDAGHSHPWAVVDLLFSITKLRQGSWVLFDDANYLAALSQGAYYFARVFSQHGHFVGNHFAFPYEGPTPDLITAITKSLELGWQTGLPSELLVDLHKELHNCLSQVDAMRIMALLLSRNVHWLENEAIYLEVHEGLWKRELERRKLLKS